MNELVIGNQFLHVLAYAPRSFTKLSSIVVSFIDDFPMRQSKLAGADFNQMPVNTLPRPASRRRLSRSFFGSATGAYSPVHGTPRYRKAAEAPPDHSLIFADHDAELRYDTRAGERSLDVMRRGLVPFWAKDIKVGFMNINAKAEGSRASPPSAKRSQLVLPGAGIVCRRWSRPTGHETGGTVLPRVVGTEGGLQARGAVSRHDGLN